MSRSGCSATDAAKRSGSDRLEPHSCTAYLPELRQMSGSVPTNADRLQHDDACPSRLPGPVTSSSGASGVTRGSITPCGRFQARRRFPAARTRRRSHSRNDSRAIDRLRCGRSRKARTRSWHFPRKKVWRDTLRSRTDHSARARRVPRDARPVADRAAGAAPLAARSRSVPPTVRGARRERVSPPHAARRLHPRRHPLTSPLHAVARRSA